MRPDEDSMCVFNTLRERLLSAGCSRGEVMMDWTIPADPMRGLCSGLCCGLDPGQVSGCM